MIDQSSKNSFPTILIVGASRGLGSAMAIEFVHRGWHVIGTIRSDRPTALHELAQGPGHNVTIETLDMDEPAQITALRKRLSCKTLDVLFVNAGTTTPEEHIAIGDVATDEFIRVMITNALSPMRVIETFQDLVPATGVIGVMSSGQGSIANNETGLREVYRGSKAALNMFMRSFAARIDDSRALILMAPGWIRTELGGPDAPFSVEEVVPKIADVLISAAGKPGLRFLDRFGQTIPW